ncbi:hypothetical protein [Campylobacter corcagiensis]|uniref:Histidine kinase n=1 Tax=Campylobacter corcagiensis TaxID=1448857 RepID=A0A7M1LFS4_9BACT|nr:hypothetical protein [Campylobacter corcagiensis]QKF64683.1 hypothetical protein CCORG_0826 [Campylobacter corcagiensis]QOQ87153.1 hypothetical protein IMC76_08050 [Campylobacter corcagiensis]
MNNKEFCEKLNISEPTLYNWKKDKPFLYKIVMEYKNENLEKNKNLSKIDELLKYFNDLSILEKEYYLSEIKARVLKKQIENKE